jgi:hypothetical protein
MINREIPNIRHAVGSVFFNKGETPFSIPDPVLKRVGR